MWHDVQVAQLCPAVCVMYNSYVLCIMYNNSYVQLMDCSLPGSHLHGILQAKILEWLPFPSPRDLPDSGIEPGSPALQADSLLSEPPGKSFKLVQLQLISGSRNMMFRKRSQYSWIVIPCFFFLNNELLDCH